MSDEADGRRSRTAGARTYAAGRPVHDVDAHLMEDEGWLARYADPGFRDRIPPLDMHGMGEISATVIAQARSAAADPTGRERAEAELMDRKNWAALGAFEPADRSRALDLLGFRSQIVFSTYGHLPLLNLPSSPGITDPDVLYAAVRAHNRGVTAFCADDPRLLPVAWVSLDVAELAVKAAREALEFGCAAIEIPSYPVGPQSLTHADLDPIYAVLEASGRPLLFHVGGGGRLVDPVFAENGRPRQARGQGHVPLMPALTYMGIPAPVETAVAALIFDGVFERHPGLRCGVIEQGASWVPGFLRRLDLAWYEFVGQRSRTLSLAPSDYVLRQVRFTPFPYEDVGWLIDQTGPELYLFSTDFPHDEGGVAPLESFVARLDGRPGGEQDMFYWRNFEDLVGAGLPDQLRVPDGLSWSSR